MPEQAATDNRNILQRYQDFRTRRFLKNEKTWAAALPRWRTRRRRHSLVIAVALSFVVMATTAVLCALGIPMAALLWLVACALFFPSWTALQIVSSRQGDAPEAALDEFEVAQRNNARSVGLTITQYLMLIPVGYLLIGAIHGLGEVEVVAYAGALMVLTVLMIGGCSPAMILAWVRPDPDPEDAALP
jgi:hypothetical protein